MILHFVISQSTTVTDPTLSGMTHVSHDCRAFILACLTADKAARPTAAQLLNHEFLQKPHSTPKLKLHRSSLY